MLGDRWICRPCTRRCFHVMQHRDLSTVAKTSEDSPNTVLQAKSATWSCSAVEIYAELSRS